jgi:serine/threonine-protein kinase
MYDEIASGGMATVHIGRLVGAVGFSRTVAIKHLHPHCSRDAEFVSMFLDEARLATRIQHPNVTVPLDVVVLDESEEIFLVMEYVHGDNLALLLRGARRSKTPVLPAISASIICGALHGLHAAHEAVDEHGTPLNIVHRDVSPQNIMVGVDGVSRVLDFGIAKAASRLQSTRQGQMKGKFAYMAPEQAGSGPVDRRADIFSAAIVFWEALTRKPLFHADDPGRVVANVLNAPIARPSFINSMVSPALDRAVMTALDRNVDTRFQTARDFATAIEDAITVSSPRKVGEWVEKMGGEDLVRRAGTLAQIEISSFDAIVSRDPLHALRSKRAPHASDNDAKPTESVSDDETVEIVYSSKTNQLSGTGRSDLLPTPPTGLSTYIPPAAHRTWLAVAGASALVLALGAGIFSLSHRSRATAAAPIGSGPLLRTTMGTGVPPQVVATRPVAAAATHAPATIPDAAPPVPAIAAASVPAPAATAAEPRSTAASERHSHPKTAATRLSSASRVRKHCDPPYTIDPSGIRRVKAECL